jgi:hypothetical protein
VPGLHELVDKQFSQTAFYTLYLPLSRISTPSPTVIYTDMSILANKRGRNPRKVRPPEETEIAFEDRYLTPTISSGQFSICVGLLLPMAIMSEYSRCQRKHTRSGLDGQRGTIMPNRDKTFLFVLYICSTESALSYNPPLS